MKSIALDTNVAIDVLNGQKDVVEEVRNYEMVYLPVTVAGELLSEQRTHINAEII